MTMSMVEKFFSVNYAQKGELFEGLSIWKEEKYQNLQGTFPVISLSFANVKEKSYETTVQRICQIVTELYNDNRFLLDGDLLSEEEKTYFRSISMDMPEVVATMAIHRLSKFLSQYYGKKVIILLDEYDTPMQEAYVNGFWDELEFFTRSMFNAAFKTNPYLECAIMTGITSVNRDAIFPDLNHLEVITTTSEKYAECFGFTEEEVFASLEEYGLSERKEEVKSWYDGFTFGSKTDIYNPWSIINYLDKKKIGVYWFSEDKVQDREDEKDLQDTVKAALQQINAKKYEASLIEKGIPKEKIRTYGFAFQGKQVLIGDRTVIV